MTGMANCSHGMTTVESTNSGVVPSMKPADVIGYRVKDRANAIPGTKPTSVPSSAPITPSEPACAAARLRRVIRVAPTAAKVPIIDWVSAVDSAVETRVATRMIRPMNDRTMAASNASYGLKPRST